MCALRLAGVRPDYRHVRKVISPGPAVTLGEQAILKWYDVAVADAPVPPPIGVLAREGIGEAWQAGELEIGGLGFAILHRCGDSFYFLLLATWAGDNEIWETVWAKNGSGDAAFRPWPRPGAHVPTFCVWELGAVWHEQQAWSRFLRSERGPEDELAYLEDSYHGVV
jgi:hypothetical protein